MTPAQLPIHNNVGRYVFKYIRSTSKGIMLSATELVRIYKELLDLSDSCSHKSTLIWVAQGNEHCLSMISCLIFNIRQVSFRGYNVYQTNLWLALLDISCPQLCKSLHGTVKVITNSLNYPIAVYVKHSIDLSLLQPFYCISI